MTYQEDDGDVQEERAQTVQEEGEQANVVHIVHGAARHLPDKGNDTVHDGADGREVVEGDDGVHLEVGRAEQALDHGKTQSLEHNTAHLENDTDGDEVNLAHGSNDDTDNDGGDIEELLQVRG